MGVKKRYIINIEIEEVTSVSEDSSLKTDSKAKNNKSDWLDPKKLEEEFGITQNTQSRYRTEKKIPYSKIGGFIFYSRTKINKWIEAHEVVC